MANRLSVRKAEPYESFSDADLAKEMPSAERGNVAVLVVHGIGEQVKFETLDSVVRALGADSARRQVVNVRIGDESASRVEIDLPSKDGQTVRHVHLYEAYWAPITEGAVGLREVITFLVDAALNGIRSARRGFRRWIFGEYTPLDVSPAKTKRSLFLAMAVVLSLVVMNAVIVALASAYGLSQTIAQNPGAVTSWVQDPTTVDDMTAIALMFCTIAFAFVTALGASGKQRPIDRAYPRVSRLTFKHFLYTCACTVLAAVAMGATIFYQNARASGGDLLLKSILRHTGALMLAATLIATIGAIAINVMALFRATSRLPLVASIGALAAASIMLVWIAEYRGSDAESVFVSTRQLVFGFADLPGVEKIVDWLADRWWAVWLLLAIISRKVRNILVQFVGDVAAYVTPHKLDRFNEIRERIKTCVGSVADAIYRAKSNGRFTYEKVIVLGHSLGSVIAYDTLNRMLRQDDLVAGNLGVKERTASLITFGSPLDKTAFLFAGQPADAGEVRAALAATIQPLVGDDSTKDVPWVNVWSELDIISGELNYYGNRVNNICDYDTVVPLEAHVHYWKTKAVWNSVLEAIAAPPRAMVKPAQFLPGDAARLPTIRRDAQPEDR